MTMSSHARCAWVVAHNAIEPQVPLLTRMQLQRHEANQQAAGKPVSRPVPSGAASGAASAAPSAWWPARSNTPAELSICFDVLCRTQHHTADMFIISLTRFGEQPVRLTDLRRLNPDQGAKDPLEPNKDKPRWANDEVMNSVLAVTVVSAQAVLSDSAVRLSSHTCGQCTRVQIRSDELRHAGVAIPEFAILSSWFYQELTEVCEMQPQSGEQPMQQSGPHQWHLRRGAMTKCAGSP